MRIPAAVFVSLALVSCGQPKAPGEETLRVDQQQVASALAAQMRGATAKGGAGELIFGGVRYSVTPTSGSEPVQVLADFSEVPEDSRQVAINRSVEFVARAMSVSDDATHTHPVAQALLRRADSSTIIDGVEFWTTADQLHASPVTAPR